MWFGGWFKHAEQVQVALPVVSSRRKSAVEYELIAEPLDFARADTSAVFQALRGVQTLPHLKPARRLRRIRERGAHKSRKMAFLMDAASGLARSLAFWKAG